VQRRRQLLNGFKKTRVYCKLKEEALDKAVWRTRFGRESGRGVRETTE
jgi:hypothetical protein